MKNLDVRAREQPLCGACPVRNLTVYLGGGGNADEVLALRKTWRRLAKRTVFVWENEVCDEFFTLHQGWAYCYRLAPDGARQIVEFLLPGDSISLTALYRNRLYFSVRTLTDATLCVFDSAAMSEFIHARPSLARRLEEFWMREFFFLSNRLVDLGRRAGPQRVARLILDLHRRMKTRGAVRNDAFEFPLRHQHIADASGLTAVHVSRIMSAWRSRGVIDLDQNILSIRKFDALTGLAQPSPTEQGYSTIA